jgi:hypothetical protein
MVYCAAAFKSTMRAGDCWTIWINDAGYYIRQGRENACDRAFAALAIASSPPFVSTLEGDDAKNLMLPQTHGMATEPIRAFEQVALWYGKLLDTRRAHPALLQFHLCAMRSCCHG